MIDVTAMMDAVTTEQTDDTFINCPESSEGYMGVIKSVEVRPWQGKADPSKSGLALDIVWTIEDESVREFCARDEVQVKQGVMLDLNDSGMPDYSRGKNISLGKLRTALDLNTPGEPFAFNMLIGRMGLVFVSHQQSPNDHEMFFAEIKKVLKA